MKTQRNSKKKPSKPLIYISISVAILILIGLVSYFIQSDTNSIVGNAKYTLLKNIKFIKMIPINNPASTCTDNDRDGYGIGSITSGCQFPNQLDCNDNYREITICTGGRSCRGAPSGSCVACTDNDRDGYGVGSVRADCQFPTEDCNDNDRSIPGACLSVGKVCFAGNCVNR